MPPRDRLSLFSSPQTSLQEGRQHIGERDEWQPGGLVSASLRGLTKGTLEEAGCQKLQRSCQTPPLDDSVIGMGGVRVRSACASRTRQEVVEDHDARSPG